MIICSLFLTYLAEIPIKSNNYTSYWINTIGSIEQEWKNFFNVSNYVSRLFSLKTFFFVLDRNTSKNTCIVSPAHSSTKWKINFQTCSDKVSPCRNNSARMAKNSKPFSVTPLTCFHEFQRLEENSKLYESYGQIKPKPQSFVAIGQTKNKNDPEHTQHF